MTESEFVELSAGHALHALSADDELAYQRALAAHPEWAHHVVIDGGMAARLAEGIPPATPAPRIREALLAQIAATPQTSRQDRDPDPAASHGAPRWRWTRALFGLAASLVLLVGLGFGVAQLTGVFSPPAAVVALDRIQQAPDAQDAAVTLADGGEATAYWSASRGEAVLVTDGIATLPADSTYELWFVRGGGPVSAGTFDASNGDATALLDGTFRPGDTIAVTVEAAGGSPTGAPTTSPILAIPTA